LPSPSLERVAALWADLDKEVTLKELRIQQERERRRRIAEAPPPARQLTLLSGLDCLSGQQDLFEVDGQK